MVMPSPSSSAAPADAAGHDGPVHAGIFENADDFAQLAHVNPVEFADQGFQGGVGLTAMGHRDDGRALLPGGLGEQERELTLTRD
jgi:hypothetical protein